MSTTKEAIYFASTTKDIFDLKRVNRIGELLNLFALIIHLTGRRELNELTRHLRCYRRNNFAILSDLRLLAQDRITNKGSTIIERAIQDGGRTPSADFDECIVKRNSMI